MHTLSHLKEELAARGLAPRKALGQNFLVDANLARKLLERSGAGSGDVVLEVGPGAGALTEGLLALGCEVVACELDAGLATLLRERFEPEAGFTLVEGDCLAHKRSLAPAVVDALGERPFRLVANLPYAAATPIIMTLLVDHPRCLGLYVTIQREVAERIAAEPRTKAYGAVSVVAQALARVERIATLPPECFWPRPKVTSVMLTIERRDALANIDPARLLGVCERLFAKRRKQIGAALGDAAHPEGSLPAGVAPTMRAEELPIEAFVALSRAD